MFDWKVVPDLGGGLNVSKHPAFINDNEWSWCDGWQVKLGTAEVMTGFEEATSASWVPATNAPIGITADLFNLGQVLVPVRNTSTDVVRLYTITAAGSATEITVSGTAPHGASVSARRGLLTPVMMNGQQVLVFGNTGSGNYTLATYDGTNFARIAPSNPLQARFLIATNNYLIAASTGGTSPTNSEMRTVRVADATSTSVWDPAISNAADEFILDSPGIIRGLVPTPDGALILTSDRVFAMSKTGGIPPFTVSVVHDGGPHETLQHGVNTPFGIFYGIVGNIMHNGAPLPAAHKVSRILNRVFGADNYMSKYLWHPARQALIIPHAPTSASATSPLGNLYYDPMEQVWWRLTNPTDIGLGLDQAIATIGPTQPPTGVPRHFLMDSTGILYVEDTVDHPTLSTPVAGAVLDTKDFAYESPTTRDYTDRIKVDWEPLSNASTDAVEVLAYVRNDLSPGILGSHSLAMDLTSNFVSLGTLTAGASELPVRLHGKFNRFRLKQSSGRVRVRGLSLRRRRGSDKRT